MGGAYVEASLLSLLRASLRRDDARMIESFLGRNGALENYGAQVDLCYLAGLIDADVRFDLTRIAKVRNEFAHKHGEITFRSDNVRSFVASFRTPKSIFIDPKVSDPSQEFQVRAPGDIAANYRYELQQYDDVLADPKQTFAHLVLALSELLRCTPAGITAGPPPFPGAPSTAAGR